MRPWWSRLCLALAAAAAPASALTPLTWAALEGRPPTIERQTTSGVYVWREGDRLFIAGVGDPAKSRQYDGRLTTHGAAIVDFQRFGGGRAGCTQASPAVANYSYSTRPGLDGVSFVLKRPEWGRHRRDWGSFDLLLHVDKHLAPRIFVGQRSVEAQQDPLVVTFADNAPVSWDSLAGQPQLGGGRNGLFAWREGDRIHLASVERGGRARRFKGRVIVCGGSLIDVRGDRLDAGDRVQQVEPTELDYSFETANDTDGVSFTLRRRAFIPASHSRFHGHCEMPSGLLYICPSNERFEGGLLQYGRDGRESPHDPLIVEFGAAQPVPWAQADGRPARLAERSGYQVWHEGERVFVLSHLRGPGRPRLNGQAVFSGGTLTRPLDFLVDDNPTDRLKLTNPMQIDFAFDGNDRVDGFGFRIERHGRDRGPLEAFFSELFGGRRPPAGPGYLTLALNIDNQPAEFVSYGPQGSVSDQAPLTLFVP